MSRMRSMGIDQNDEVALRHGRNVNMGMVIQNEFHQPVPFFYTREKWPLQLVGMYRGRSAFLVASGPSFNKVDKSLLNKPGIWVMTLNNAMKSFRGNASCIVDDPSRFVSSLWLDPKIMKFVPADHFEKPIWDNRTIIKNGQPEYRWCPMNMKVGDCPAVIGYHRNEKFHAPRFLYEETINWGCHKRWGGGRSVMLAALRILFLLGFRKVYLVGVDFEMTPEKNYHFDEGRTASAIKGNMSTYSKLIQWFSELKPYFDKEGFIVKNCNPESNLRVFPMIKFEDAIKESTEIMGDVDQERSKGMYSKYEEKIAVWQQFQNNQNLNDEQKTQLINIQEDKSRSNEKIEQNK